MASENVLKQKEEEVKKLAEKLKEAKVILLTDYRGINVADVTKLRTDLRNKVKVETEILQAECEKILKDFFNRVFYDRR